MVWFKKVNSVWFVDGMKVWKHVHYRLGRSKEGPGKKEQSAWLKIRKENEENSSVFTKIYDIWILHILEWVTMTNNICMKLHINNYYKMIVKWLFWICKHLLFGCTKLLL